VTITLAALRTRSLQHADAVSSPRWSVALAGEVDQLIGTAHAKEWRRILNANPYQRVALRSVTLDSTGRVPIASLSDVTLPDSSERFYRILLFTAANIVLKEVPGKDAFTSLLATSVTGVGSGVYFRIGDYFQAPGYESQAASIWVNHIPTRADALSVDTKTVVFPEDYEDVLAYEAAALILSKGGAEADAAAVCKAYAEDLRRDMLQDITRTSINPLVMQYPDSASEWGG
jgi:hypothetical protein